jgi:hypothetical protein
MAPRRSPPLRTSSAAGAASKRSRSSRPSHCDTSDGSTERPAPSRQRSNAVWSRRAGCCAKPRSTERWLRRPNRSRKRRPSAARGDIAFCDRGARAEVFWGERAVAPSGATSRNNQPPAPSDAPWSACSVHPNNRMWLLPAGRRRSIVGADVRVHTSERRNAAGSTSGPTSTACRSAGCARRPHTRRAARRRAAASPNPSLLCALM